jgi:large conductance mechanosensitive channel
MINGFKEFLMRGNVVELAVAVVMGAAMTALDDYFVKALL